MTKQEKEETRGLRHGPIPGYGKALCPAMAASVAYLGPVFLSSSGQAGENG